MYARTHLAVVERKPGALYHPANSGDRANDSSRQGRCRVSLDGLDETCGTGAGRRRAIWTARGGLVRDRTLEYQ